MNARHTKWLQAAPSSSSLSHPVDESSRSARENHKGRAVVKTGAQSTATHSLTRGRRLLKAASSKGKLCSSLPAMPQGHPPEVRRQLLVAATKSGVAPAAAFSASDGLGGRRKRDRLTSLLVCRCTPAWRPSSKASTASQAPPHRLPVAHFTAVHASHHASALSILRHHDRLGMPEAALIPPPRAEGRCPAQRLLFPTLHYSAWRHHRSTCSRKNIFMRAVTRWSSILSPATICSTVRCARGSSAAEIEPSSSHILGSSARKELAAAWQRCTCHLSRPSLIQGPCQPLTVT